VGSPSDRTGLSRTDKLFGVGLAALYLLLLAVTLDIGFPRDESFYFSAGEQYSYWFDDLIDDPAKAFERKNVERRFKFNPEHPALPKVLFGLSWRVFGDMRDPETEPFARHWYSGGKPPKPILGLMSESTAMRLPALVVNSFLVFLIYVFGTQFFNRRVGFAAAAAWMFMPHVFWHSHLACFDIPVTSMWFLTGYCFLRAEQGGWKWAILTGIAFGLAISVKHNAFFLPPIMLFYFVVTRWRQFKLGRDAGGTGIRLPSIPLAFFSMLVVSPVVYYVLWPELWFEPLEHMKWYIGRHAGHEYYWAYYFGNLYTKPPFPVAFPFVMSAVTIPAPTVMLFLAGMGRVVRDRLSTLVGWATEGRPVRQNGVVLFVILSFLVPFAVIAVPSVPIFGGTKHWIHGVPYLALLAGLGFDLVFRAVIDLGRWVPSLGGRMVRGALISSVCLVFLAPVVLDTLHGHTNGSTYYNAAVGGFGAMGDHGMQREFWGNSSFSALKWINREAPEGARVDFHDTTFDAIRMYKRDGLLRKDIVPVWNFRRADFFLFHWHKEFLDLEARVKRNFGVAVPAMVAAQDGVPILNVYRRPPKVGNDKDEPDSGPDKGKKRIDSIRKIKDMTGAGGEG